MVLALQSFPEFWQNLGQDANTAMLHALVIAAAAVIIYWALVPGKLRLIALLAISFFILASEGATIWFILLLALLTLMTRTAACRGPEGGVSYPRELAAASLGYVITLALCVLGAAMQSGQAGFPQGAGAAGLVLLSGVFFVLLAFHAREAVRQEFRRWPRRLFTWLAVGAPGNPSSAGLLHGAWMLVGLAVLTLIVMSGLAFVQAEIFSANARMAPFILSRLAVVGLFALALAALSIIQRAEEAIFRRWLGYCLVVMILLSFLALKSPGQRLPGFVNWVGFSYLAFRLLSVLIDSFNRRHTDASSLEMLVYALFFPALLIGPIDRLPRFLGDMRGEPRALRWSLIVEGLTRILIGGVKKFFLADLLFSQLAFKPEHLAYPGAAFAWVQAYCYALYIFFDFAGYTDIALGTGRLLGYTLPENFNSPYLKPNITQFWQSWHMTLSGWLRDYVFTPLSRRLLRTPLRRHPQLIVFIAQMVTMILIGLWHNIALNFVLWGAWHGLGLFIHKVFTDRTRWWQPEWKHKPVAAASLHVLSVLLTFHFTTLGAVFVAVGNPGDIATIMLRLFGLSR